jgi:hypothetical protein
MQPPTNTRQTLDDLFGIDVRGLAAFRIALGLLIAAQAVIKLRQIALPPEPSLTGWANLDWLVLLVCGAFIVAGRGTRWACLLAWPVMFRHVMLDWHDTGVEIHRYLMLIGLFWNLFIPSDELGRLGGAGDKASPIARRILSFATAALLVQVFFVYFSGGVAKAHVEWVVQADALTNLMHTHFATPLGRSLLAWPWVLQFLSVATIVLEVLGPLACFLPVRGLAKIRIAVIAVMASFHLGLLLAMNLETIPLVVQTYWLLMIPSQVWDRVWPRTDLLPHTAGEPSAFLAAVSKLMLAGMCASFVISMLVTCDPTGNLLVLHKSAPKIGIYQDWRMFRSPATLRQIDAAREQKS